MTAPDETLTPDSSDDLAAERAFAVMLELIEQGQAALQRDGLCLLPEFVAPAALRAMAAEAQSLVPAAHWRDQMNGVWRYDADEEAFPSEHPRRRRHARMGDRRSSGVRACGVPAPLA